jgi:ABC-type sugar transport system substrate-binding protein
MKIIAVVVSLFLIIINFSSCGNKDAKFESTIPQKSIVLGFAQVGDESDWRTANSNSIKSAAAEAGIQLMFSDAQQKPENQIKAVRSFIANQVDVIAFSPIVEDGWDMVLKEAKDAGIPVILTDRTIEIKDESLYTTVIGSDFKEEGRKAGRWLVEKLKDVKGEINIVEIQGTIGSAPAIDRKEGFEEIIKKEPNMKITMSESADFMRSKGYEVMQNFLVKQGRNINVLFSHNDDMAFGAIKAIEEYGLKPGKDIIILSIDANKGAFKQMIQGKLNCSVECNPLLGPQLMQLVKDLVNGKKIERRIYSKESIFPAEIAKRELPNRKY